MAHVDGTSPASGTWAFYSHDRLKSTHGVWSSSKSEIASADYEPYGSSFQTSGNMSRTSRTFTGHDWDSLTKQYFTPFRYLMPDGGRWQTRDPLGAVDGMNLYLYAQANPTNFLDVLGLITNAQAKKCTKKFEDCAYKGRIGPGMEVCTQCLHKCTSTGKWPATIGDGISCEDPPEDQDPDPDPNPDPWNPIDIVIFPFAVVTEIMFVIILTPLEIFLESLEHYDCNRVIYG
jgi:RHS repeat-associated protein